MSWGKILLKKKDKKINGTTTQTKITKATTESRSYWNGYWKLQLLKQLLKIEITRIITQFFYISRIICHNGKNSWHYKEEVIKHTKNTLNVIKMYLGCCYLKAQSLFSVHIFKDMNNCAWTLIIWWKRKIFICFIKCYWIKNISSIVIQNKKYLVVFHKHKINDIV